MLTTFLLIFVILLVMELVYFKIADKCNVIDKPNERSSHNSVVLRGGGIIFLFGVWVWSAFFGFPYFWFLLAITLVAGVSFIDDIRSLPDKIRLVVQFIAMAMMFYHVGLFEDFTLANDFSDVIVATLQLLCALVVFVGASNIINFMDGINGITGGYAMASLIPLYILNKEMGFVHESLIIVVALADIVFCLFNFRPKGKAKCFAGDVGSMGIAYILIFIIGCLVLRTKDVTYLIFLMVYGVDGVLTIIHRIMLHENIGQAHRKHAYQLMANELKIGHMKVTIFYVALQLLISIGFIFVCPDTIACHWMYFVGTLLLLCASYVLFMKKYYHLHEEYLKSLRK